MTTPNDASRIISEAIDRWTGRRWERAEPVHRVVDRTTDGTPILCPSYPERRGLGVIFVVGDASPEVDDEIVPFDDPRLTEAPIAAQRTAGMCARSACGHWMDACQLGIGVAATNSAASPVPVACPISSRCRWRLENGDAACTPCRTLTRLTQ